MNSVEAHRQAIAALEAERLRYGEVLGRLQAALDVAVARFDAGNRELCVKGLQRALDIEFEALGDTAIVDNLAASLGLEEELAAYDEKMLLGGAG